MVATHTAIVTATAGGDDGNDDDNKKHTYAAPLNFSIFSDFISPSTPNSAMGWGKNAREDQAYVILEGGGGGSPFDNIMPCSYPAHRRKEKLATYPTLPEDCGPQDEQEALLQDVSVEDGLDGNSKLAHIICIRVILKDPTHGTHNKTHRQISQLYK